MRPTLLLTIALLAPLSASARPLHLPLKHHRQPIAPRPRLGAQSIAMRAGTADPAFSSAVLRASPVGGAMNGRWLPTKKRVPQPGHEYFLTHGYLNPPQSAGYSFRIFTQMGEGKPGSTYPVDVRVSRKRIDIRQQIYLNFDATVRPKERKTYRVRLLRAMRSYLDDQFVLVDRTTGSRQRIRMHVEFVDRRRAASLGQSFCEVTVTGRDAKGALVEGRENAASLYLGSEPKTMGHELSHRLLTAIDEYVDKDLAPDRKIPRRRLGPPSLMQDVWSKGTRLLPTHAMSLARLMGHLTGHPHAVALSTRAKVELRRSGYPLPEKPKAAAAAAATPAGHAPRKHSFLSSLFRRPGN